MKELPFDHTKLLNVPYIQLLEYGVRKALDNRRFTKEEACQAYPDLTARWDELAPDLLSQAKDGTYVIRAEVFLQYLNLVSLQDSRRHARRAHITSLAAISISIVLLLLRLLGI